MTPRIYHVVFPDGKTMCSTLVRMSEMYENPRFRGKKFSLEEFRTWYKESTGHKVYTYNRDWDGFNLPYENLLQFQVLYNDVLTKQEAAFLALLTQNGAKKNGYVICTSLKSEPTTFKHEYCHALYGTNGHFRTAVKKLVSGPEFEVVRDWLRSDYDESVLLDETAAYLTEDYRYIERKTHSRKHTFKDVAQRLNNLYDRYSINLRKESSDESGGC